MLFQETNNGLDREAWVKILHALEKLGHVYEKVNITVSMGFSRILRNRIASMLRIKPGMKILDVGSGPGNMAEVLEPLVGRNGIIYCYDASLKLLKLAKLKVSRGSFIVGLMEAMPFRAGFFDVIVYSFSIRDAISRTGTLRESRRILKKGGRIGIIELVRPDDRFKASVLDFYVSRVVPVLSIGFYGSLNTPWRYLSKTLKSMDTASEIVRRISDMFEVEECRIFFGCLCSIVARKV